MSNETVEFEGTVREIDLDAKRFELRRVAHAHFEDIRCVYSYTADIQPRHLLDSRVRVRGRIERRSDETPRLMAIEFIEILEPAKG